MNCVSGPSKSLLLGILLLVRFDCGRCVAEELPGSGFFQAYCHDCHAKGASEGGLDLGKLDRDLAQPQTLAMWIRIHDRVKDGEMPPPDAKQPSEKNKAEFLATFGKPISEAHAQAKGTVLRRLNRREYENTVNDIFATNLDLVPLLPADGRSHEFDNVGEALNISMEQLKRYLEAVDLAIETSIAKTTEKPQAQTIRASYAATRGAEQFLGKQWLKLPDGAVVFYRNFGYPTGMLREANALVTGKYKIRIKGYAHQSKEPITFAVGATTFQRGAEQPTFGYYTLPPGNPSVVELEAWIEARYMVDVTVQGLSDPNYEIKNKGVENYKGPGLAIQSIELEGPIVEEFPSRGHHLLFDGLVRKEIEPRNPNDKRRPNYRPQFQLIASAEEVEPILVRIASRAFRRPASEEEVSPYLTLYQSEIEEGSSAEEALKTATAAIFCSPDFLYLRESQGELDDYALASRLSYFLTRSLPDEELMGLAKAGKLTRDSNVLAEQTERLLNYPHSARFVEEFTDTWLNLRDINFTTPDQQLFPEFNPFLQFSMLAETRSYFRELIEKNLSVTNLVKSDFAMLNSRLAEHYGIAGVEGPEIRKVTLPFGSERGGFLSQSSILKVSANGTNTSPVVRGVWVMERILGESPPPPPPGIPGVEPDIRGAETLRQLLDKHRSSDNCRACHQKIDPPGFALESFDPTGAWRDRFRTLGEGQPVNLNLDGRKVRYKLGPLVDASCELPDGEKFSGFKEFRDHLASQPDRLAKTLATKLLIFATGREMGFSDREEIARIVKESAKTNHGVRDLIHLTIASEIFRWK